MQQGAGVAGARLGPGLDAGVGDDVVGRGVDVELREGGVRAQHLRDALQEGLAPAHNQRLRVGSPGVSADLLPQQPLRRPSAACGAAHSACQGFAYSTAARRCSTP